MPITAGHWPAKVVRRNKLELLRRAYYERPYTGLPMLALICPRLDLYMLVILYNTKYPSSNLLSFTLLS